MACSKTIRMTYLGLAKIDGENYICSSMSASAETRPEFYDHVIGLLDDAGAGSETKGEGTDGGGTAQVQKGIYRFSPILPKASISGPCAEDNGSAANLLELARDGKKFDAETIFYQDGSSYSLTDCYISNFSLNISAGDVGTFSCDIVGTSIADSTGTSYDLATCTKLLTWDRFSISAPELTTANDIATFSLSISNPIIPIYTAGQNSTDLFPKKLRIGIQEVTGSIGLHDFNGLKRDQDKITFNIGDDEYNINVVYTPGSGSADGGKFVSTVQFFGRKYQGFVWE